MKDASTGPCCRGNLKLNHSFNFINNAPKIKPPAKACDCHIHVFGPASKYPYAPERTYTPFDALYENAFKMLKTLGMERVVLIQPSVYGNDNRCLLDALARFENRARGVAVVDGDVAPEEIEKLHRAGVRGLRLNYEAVGNLHAAGLAACMRTLADRIRDFSWHLQVYVAPELIGKLAPVIEGLPVDVVFDHMGKINPEAENAKTSLEVLRSLLEKERCWIKLSGPYRLGVQSVQAESIRNLARSLIHARPDRIVWGSDWPHVPFHGHASDPKGQPVPFQRIDTGSLLNLLVDWAPDKQLLRRILVENPARLYDFLD